MASPRFSFQFTIPCPRTNLVLEQQGVDVPRRWREVVLSSFVWEQFRYKHFSLIKYPVKPIHMNSN